MKSGNRERSQGIARSGRSANRRALRGWRFACLLFTLCCAPIGPSAGAQEPPQPIFPQLFAHRTGCNGYEELVTAVDAIATSKLAGEAVKPGATLTIKRAALQDPVVRQALQLMRTGLSKPVLPPRTKLAPDTKFPELFGFRQLARLLCVEAYVFLADGNAGAAISDLRLGLRLGSAIQKQTLIAGLVGIAIDGTVLNMIAQHLDQFSVRDCDGLIALAREWLAMPDPASALIGADQDAVLGILDRARVDPQGFMDAAGWTPEEKDQAQQFLANLTLQDPGAVDKLANDLAFLMSARYAAFQEELRKPYPLRSPVPPVPTDTLVGMVFYRMGIEPAYERASDRFVTDQTQIQLLAVHAAIHKYRWEHECWPPSLGVLSLGTLALDPFTGRPFAYRVTSSAYELSSAGPPDRSGESVTPQSRTQVYLPNRP